MPVEILDHFRRRNALHEIKAVNENGQKIFDCLLFPRKYHNPQYILSKSNKQQISDYWNRIHIGLRLTIRRDDPNYDPGMNDGRFVQEALEEEEEQELFAQLEYDTQIPELSVVDETTLPFVRHTLITFGIMNQLPKDQLPYADEFGLEAKQFWGRKLTVSRVRQMTEDLKRRVDERLFNDNGSNYQILPVAQFFNIGSQLSTRIWRQAYFNEPYLALDSTASDDS